MYKLYFIENSYLNYLLTEKEADFLDEWFMIDYHGMTDRMLENAQYLYIEDPENTEEVRKICQKAARALRSALKKEENLIQEKRLADVYALQAQTYTTEKSGLKINFPQARDYARKQVELRKSILEKEPDALNTFLYGSALYDLGLILERINQSTQGPEERTQGMEWMKKSLDMARKEDLKELESLIEKRIYFMLAYESSLYQFGYFSDPDYARALERSKEWLEYARILMKTRDIQDIQLSDPFFSTLIHMLYHVQELYEKNQEPEKSIPVLTEGLKWARALLKEKLDQIEYWKTKKLQWAYKIWERIYDIQKLYMLLFTLYEQDGQKEEAREVLEQLEEFAKSGELKELKDNVERKQNYALCQSRIDSSLAEGYETLQNYEKAEKFYQKALENLDQAQRERKTYYGRERLEETFEDLISLYEKMNEPKKVKEIETRQKKTLDALDQYEEDEDNYYDDEMIRFPLFEADIEYLETRGERAFDF